MMVHTLRTIWSAGDLQMLSIDSIKGRSVVFYASVAVAVLLSVAAVVLAYDSSGAEGGGETVMGQ